MSDRIHAAIELTRVVSRLRWGFYFDLFCMVAIGMSLRPALSSLEPVLAVAKGAYSILASERCPIRMLLTFARKMVVASASAPSRTGCNA
jgi:hypothetical protein